MRTTASWLLALTLTASALGALAPPAVAADAAPRVDRADRADRAVGPAGPAGRVVAAGLDAQARPTCAGLRATIVGNNRGTKIVGTDGRDVIVARGGGDRINAGGGDDVICAGEGADVVYAGPGDDVVYGEADRYRADRFGRARKTGDTIFPGGGNDTVDVGFDPRPTTPGVAAVPNRVSYSSAPAPAIVDLRANPAVVAADGVDSIVTVPGYGLGFVGTAFDDVVRGTTKDDRLAGLGGNDQLFGSGGDDQLVGDASGDVAGNDLLDGGTGADRLVSRTGYDVLRGGAGSDVVASSSLQRLDVSGGSGLDTITVPVPGETGFTVVGGSGQDRLRLTPFPNPALVPTLRIDAQRGVTKVTRLFPTTLTGKVQSFTDVRLPGSTKSIYKGSNKSEAITADPGWAVTIKGRGGPDFITGSNLADRLTGGRGFDIVRGLGGRDRCFSAERRTSC